MDEGQLDNDLRETIIRVDGLSNRLENLEKGFNAFQTNISQTIVDANNSTTPLVDLKPLQDGLKAHQEWLVLVDRAIKELRMDVSRLKPPTMNVNPKDTTLFPPKKKRSWFDW